MDKVDEVDLEPQTLADKWILSRFHALQTEVTDHLEAYEFSQAGEKLREGKSCGSRSAHGLAT